MPAPQGNPNHSATKKAAPSKTTKAPLPGSAPIPTPPSKTSQKKKKTVTKFVAPKPGSAPDKPTTAIKDAVDHVAKKKAEASPKPNPKRVDFHGNASKRVQQQKKELGTAQKESQNAVVNMTDSGEEARARARAAENAEAQANAAKAEAEARAKTAKESKDTVDNPVKRFMSWAFSGGQRPEDAAARDQRAEEEARANAERLKAAATEARSSANSANSQNNGSQLAAVRAWDAKLEAEQKLKNARRIAGIVNVAFASEGKKVADKLDKDLSVEKTEFGSTETGLGDATYQHGTGKVSVSQKTTEELDKNLAGVTDEDGVVTDKNKIVGTKSGRDAADKAGLLWHEVGFHKRDDKSGKAAAVQDQINKIKADGRSQIDRLRSTLKGAGATPAEIAAAIKKTEDDILTKAGRYVLEHEELEPNTDQDQRNFVRHKKEVAAWEQANPTTRGEKPKAYTPLVDKDGKPLSKEDRLKVLEDVYTNSTIRAGALKGTTIPGSGTQVTIAQYSRDLVGDLYDTDETVEDVEGRSRPGDDRAGRSRPGEDREGRSRPGDDREGRSRPGDDREGRSRPGHDREGRSRPGRSRPGVDRA